ncbi:hypothetical protein LPJ72_004957, partial [Coemansia sp. Benny D160-2]
PLHESYAGHISVRNWKAAADGSANSGEAKLFYWYFPAIAPKVEEPPLLLWIQGGPGSSSMIGLFTELGPLELTDDGEFFRRNVSWANSYDLLVVDQPAGTGFSSVRPKKSPALDDLFPLARKLPRHIADEWRASYPGDVNQYSSIKSPMTAEYAVAEARATLEHLKSQTGKWPDRKMRFVNKLESILNARESQVFGMDPFAPNSNRQKMYVDSGRPRELDLPVRRIVDDPYLVNNGYDAASADAVGSSGHNRSIWEKIGLPADESGDFVDGYVTNMRAVGKDMWTFMQKFYALRPELQRRNFYIFSESYGGKYVPAIASYFVQRSEQLQDNAAELPINLRGVSIGNSWVHPMLQILAHGTIGFSWGLLDANQADTVDLLAFKALNHVLDGDLEAASTARLLMFDYYANVTGGVNWYDVRKRNHKYKRTYLDRGLNHPIVRKALHSEKDPYSKDWGVGYHLSKDIMRTSAPMFPYLLEKDIPVHLVQGQFDFRDGVAGNTLWINGLEWKGKQPFAHADRQQWWMQKELVGYARSGGLLTHRVVLNAGHMAPGDQPEACLDMVAQFLRSVGDPSA